MKLLETYSHNKSVSGFTLIELLLVMALMLIVGVTIAPIGISFYQTQILNEVSDGLISTMRQAQSFALTGKNNQNYGVYISEDEYVLFAGDDYSARDVSMDSAFPIKSAISILGPSEIIFSKLSGEPSTTGTLTISLGRREREIVILPSGNIDK